ncbi:MAG: GAF domain-containing sensor histidine kinase [Solirubrobacteraceae bacterium]
MIAPRRTRDLGFEDAEARLAEHLRQEPRGSPARHAAVLAVAAMLFALTFGVRLAIHDPDALLANFYVVPIALVAIEFGTAAGVAAAALALGLVFAWSAIETIHVNFLGYSSRTAVFVVTGVVVGTFSQRLRQDIAARQRAQRHLSLYAEQLARANHQLARTVEQLEAFSEIARAVGGETELRRVLSLILEHGRGIVSRRLVVYLLEGEELVAVSGAVETPEDRTGRLPIVGSLPGEVLRSGRARRCGAGDERLAELDPVAAAAILVPLVFRGETLGVLVGIDLGERRPASREDEDEDEQLLGAIAASAATAVATARSVASERLQVSIDAAEQARARWARELHDETLQGLSGVRMVLSAGLARDDLDSLRRAGETADAHLGDEMRRLRDLVAELRPAALDDLGLGPAIESLARRQATIGGLVVRTQVELGERGRLTRESEGAIYRIVQEALSNVVKHGCASTASVSVRELGDRIEVSVQDDGCGFDPSIAREGFGLTGMRERALLAGGHLSVTSGGNQSTRVEAVIPLRADPHALGSGSWLGGVSAPG